MSLSQFDLRPAPDPARASGRDLLLSALGGIGGGVIGFAATAGYAACRSRPIVKPAWATAGALTAAVLIGGIAGLHPAVRAARLPPGRSGGHTL